VAKIACFWVEKDGDAWVRKDTGERQPYPGAFGIGAMWDAVPNYREHEIARGGADRGDGHFPVVLTPGGEWVIDGCAYSDGAARPCPWTREGDPTRPETFTAHPSIHFPGRYHGWLRAGFLVDA
jgi:hypothetical protein